MPEKKTIERARKAKREGKAPTTQAGAFVREEMEHIREGKHGAKNTKQAIAIGLSKARRSGVDLPPPPAERGKKTRKAGGSKRAAGGARTKAKRGTSRTKASSARKSPKRSRASTEALKRQPRTAASSRALSRQGRQAARGKKRTARRGGGKRAGSSSR